MNLPAGLTWRPESLPQQKEEGEAPRAPKQNTGQSATAGPDGTKTGTKDQDAAKQKTGQTPPQDACMNQLPLMAGLLIVFYFLLIRPGQKQEKQLKALRSSLKKDDLVVTTGGMHGTVVSVDESSGTVRIKTDQDGHTQLTFDLSAVGRVVRGEEAAS